MKGIVIEQLSESITAARTTEDLVRPLLQMLAQLTGFESTYLTSIDEQAGIQSVEFALNTDELHIPEGLAVPWSDTLCRRCLEEGRRSVSNVEMTWPDAHAARAIGIHAYASAPVLDGNGVVIGTLCAASRHSRSVTSRGRSTLNLFSKLIGQHIEREHLLTRLRESNEYLAKFALTDALTGLPNRRALRDELGRLLARAARDGARVIVGMIDLDDFKQINDMHGHAAGDAFLRAFAQRLQSVARDTDVLARLGGDEFAIVGPGPADAEQADAAARALAERVSDISRGRYVLPDTSIDYLGASAGIVAVSLVSAEQALDLADAAMYRCKKARKATLRESPSPAQAAPPR